MFHAGHKCLKMFILKKIFLKEDKEKIEKKEKKKATFSTPERQDGKVCCHNFLKNE